MNDVLPFIPESRPSPKKLLEAHVACVREGLARRREDCAHLRTVMGELEHEIRTLEQEEQLYAEFFEKIEKAGL